MNYKNPLFTIILIVLPFFKIHSQIYVNELMQSNIDCVRDDLQEFPDSWIELYNNSEEEVNLQNWVISTIYNYDKGWKIKNAIKIKPKDYFLIYCDKVDKGIHTNFKLDSGKGGNIYLFNNKKRNCRLCP